MTCEPESGTEVQSGCSLCLHASCCLCFSSSPKFKPDCTIATPCRCLRVSACLPSVWVALPVILAAPPSLSAVLHSLPPLSEEPLARLCRTPSSVSSDRSLPPLALKGWRYHQRNHVKQRHNKARTQQQQQQQQAHSRAFGRLQGIVLGCRRQRKRWRRKRKGARGPRGAAALPQASLPPQPAVGAADVELRLEAKRRQRERDSPP